MGLRLPLLGALLLGLSACSVNPVTGEKEFSLMSASQEVAMGEQNYDVYQQQQGGRYVVDPDLTVYVNQVGQKLARVSDRPDLPYEFVVLNDSTPNAWALPGGKIAINRGLLVLLEDEAQLAAVLGHEIVHAAARHTAQRMTQTTLLQAGMVAVGVATQDTSYGQWAAMGAGLGANLWQAKYSRDQETQADEYGIAYMNKAGYDARGAVELQEKFVELAKQQSGGGNNWFASHPPSEQRVAYNQQLAQKYSGGERNRSAYQRAIAQIKKDAPAYERHQQALAAASENNIARALELADAAAKAQPREPLFHITRGQLLLKDRPADALAAFDRASQLYPEYFLGHLGAGLAYRQLNRASDAERALKRSAEIVPTPLATYHLGELALQRGARGEARQYFEFAAQGEGAIADAARGQLQKLPPG